MRHDEVINLVDLRSVTEGIKIQFVQQESMRFQEAHFFNNGGFTRFSASVTYQIIGAFLDNDRMINVVVHITKFDCFEIVLDFALASFAKRVKRDVIKKIPEAEGQIKLFIARKEDLSSFRLLSNKPS